MPKFIVKTWTELQEYSTIWQQMRELIDNMSKDSPDQIWLLEHQPVYTLGQAGDSKHILRPGNIPIVRSDRGGQVTYHGPGQIMVYTMLNIKRLGTGIKSLVCKLEQAVIDMLLDLNINASRQPGRPGVYVEEKKICSIGLRIRKGYSYHGLAINYAVSKDEFANINPCGYSGLEIANIKDYASTADCTSINTAIVAQLERQFNLVSSEK
jgi:lipoyl(octanoyl) transferase